MAPIHQPPLEVNALMNQLPMHFNRAQRRMIKKVAKARGMHGFAAEVDRICDGLERDVFNKHLDNNTDTNN